MTSKQALVAASRAIYEAVGPLYHEHPKEVVHALLAEVAAHALAHNFPNLEGGAIVRERWKRWS